MDALLDEQYFTWLYSLVGSVKARVRKRTHWGLLEMLHRMDFEWLIPNDDNRAADGRDLRDEFLRDVVLDPMFDEPWYVREKCSVLEMLIALSRRVAFEVDGDPKNWFWHFIEVLELEQFNDFQYDAHAESTVEATVTRVVWRKYSSNGSGGLFPLRNPVEDQREVELWYQLSAYLLEQF